MNQRELVGLYVENIRRQIYDKNDNIKERIEFRSATTYTEHNKNFICITWRGHN